MAIIYVDQWETTLSASIAAADDFVPVPSSMALRVAEALAINTRLSDSEAQAVGRYWLRVPLIIDNGTGTWEWVEATYADSIGLYVVRGATPLAWPSGTAIRCAPPAGHVAAGFCTTRNVVSNTAFGVPGETVAWAPSGAGLTLKLPARGPGWYDQEQAFAGDEWPMRIVLAVAGVARTIGLFDHTGYGVNQVWFADGLKSSLTIPATATWAVLEISKLPIALRSAGAAAFTGRVELF